MTLIKISENFINLDNVMHITDHEGVLVLYFNGENGDRPYSWYFEGEDAVKLRTWLNDKSEVL